MERSHYGMNLCPAISQLCSKQTHTRQAPFLCSAAEVFALGSLQSLEQAATPPAARGTAMQALSWTTVCSHPHIREIISLVNNITLTMQTASCPPARQLLPLLWSCASAEPACPHCPPQLTAHCTVLPGSCKDPLAFCTPQDRVGDCVFVVISLSPLHFHQPSGTCLTIFPSAVGFPRGECNRADQAVYSAENKRGVGWPDLDLHTAFLRLLQEKDEVFISSRIALSSRGLISQQPLLLCELLLSHPIAPNLLGKIWLCYAAHQMCVWKTGTPAAPRE